MPRFLVFNNSTLIQPQAAVQVIDDALAGTSTGGSGDLCLVGVSRGGKPGVPLYFSTPQDARATLIGGDGLRAALRAFAVSPGFQGAPRVVFIRVGAPTQATGSLSDVNNQTTITLTSTDYGALTNLVKLNVSTGTNAGSRRLTFYNNGQTAVVDNVARAGINLQYLSTTAPVYGIGPLTTAAATTLTATPTVGAVSLAVADGSKFTTATTRVLVGAPGSANAEVLTATITSNPPTGPATLTVGATTKAHLSGDPVAPYTGEQGLAIFSAATPGDNAVLSFSAYPSLQTIVDALNQHPSGHYAAVLVAPNPVAPSVQLDAVSPGVTLAKTGDGAPFSNLMQNLQAVIDAINTNSQTWVSAAAYAQPGLPPKIEGPVSPVWHALAGGADGTTTTADWQNALNTAATIDCSVIIPATGDASVHALFVTHVDFEATAAERHERICLLGGVAGETVAQTVSRADLVRDPRVGLVWPGIIDVDTTQTISGPIVLDPWLVAAQLGGMFCGGGVSEALTGKYIRAEGVEQVLNNSDRDTLLLAGVIPILYIQNRGFRVAHSQSTWLADTNFRKNELSTMRAADALTKFIRDQLEQFVGRVMSPQLNVLAYSATESSLIDMQEKGIIVGNTQNPAYKNIQIGASGDVLAVSFQASIAVPANYITITASLLPFSGNLS